MEFFYLYMMYGNWLKELYFEVKCYDFDWLVLDIRWFLLYIFFDCENDVKWYYGEMIWGNVLLFVGDFLVL